MQEICTPHFAASDAGHLCDSEWKSQAWLCLYAAFPSLIVMFESQEAQIT